MLLAGTLAQQLLVQTSPVDISQLIAAGEGPENKQSAEDGGGGRLGSRHSSDDAGAELLPRHLRGGAGLAAEKLWLHLSLP